MKFVYKGTTYRTELLNDEQKALMSKEIAKEEKRQAYLQSLKNLAIEEPKKGKKEKSLDE